MNNNTISIIIPMYNARVYIKECIENITNSENKDYEVIIVDDCSDDDSVKIARQMGCRLISLNLPQGPGAARNAGAKVATGEILFFIDSDIFIAKNTLTLIRESFEKFADISGVVGIYSLENGHHNAASRYKNLYVHYEAQSKPDFISTFRSSVFAIKKRRFQELGGFDASLGRLPCEDWEFSIKASNRGLKFHLNRKMTVRHAKKINLLNLIKGDFMRTYNFARVFYRKRMMAKEYYAKSFIGSFVFPVTELVLPGISLSFFILSVALKSIAFSLLGTSALIGFFILEFPFIRYAKKYYGSIFLLKSFCFKYMEMLICEIAAPLGFVRGVIEWK